LADPFDFLGPTLPATRIEEPYLSVEIRDRVGTLELDVSFQLSKPWTVLFGPSGSGKTTILRTIAGIHRPAAARIVGHSMKYSTIRAAILSDTAHQIHLLPHERATPFAPQNPCLFPHMTVLENINYRTRGFIGPAERDYWEILNEKLPTMFSIKELLSKKPWELSGGEARRVSLVRAMMARGRRLLLLDEPFSGLDAPLRDSIVDSVLAWQERVPVPILHVTHDVAEAFQIGAEVIRIAEGKVVAQGPVEAVLAEERDRLLRQLGSSTSQIRDVGYPAEGSSEPYLSG
jgi:molybdate transport system ATP-binding protein